MIPALAESATLFATLSSLACNPPELCERFLILVVVNHREDAPLSDKADNRATLKLLETGAPQLSRLKLAWIDAASAGLEMPVKGGGVGLARRIGLDFALSRLDGKNADPVLVCLDADTLVCTDYLPALVRHFEKSRCGAAVIPFCHQVGATVESDRIITRYELFLRSYVLGLTLAGSPYAFHSVGSAMACRASAYRKIGGMNSRSAGEDFYFLQQLARTVGVEQLTGTVVHPSPRPSHRVPFGTGRSVSRMQAGGEQLFYHPSCFYVLGAWLALVSKHTYVDGASIRKQAGEISPGLEEFLDLNRFEEIWEKLRRNNPGRAVLIKAFHGWFDGLKTMKLIHHLSAGPFPRCQPEFALRELFERAELAPVSGIENHLKTLRLFQNDPQTGRVPAPP